MNIPPWFRISSLAPIGLTLTLLWPTALFADAGQWESYHERPVVLNDSDAQVRAFVREGQVRRLYGEAFSSGPSVEASAQAFIHSNASILGTRASDLAQTDLQPMVYDPETDSYRFTGVGFQQQRDGVPVYGARLVLLVRNEPNHPLVLASANLRELGGFAPRVAQSEIDAGLGMDEAEAIAPELQRFSDPELVIWAGVEDAPAPPVLAYTFIGDNLDKRFEAEPQRYRFVTDAVTGEILHEENLIHFVDVSGNVSGMATEGLASDDCEDEVLEGMPWARVSIAGGNTAFADAAGDFVIPNAGSSPVTVESMLRGSWFRTFNQAGSEEVLSEGVTPPGPADFLHNSANNNELVRAQVNGYLQSNVVRDFTLTYNPDYPGLQHSEFPVYVNRSDGYCPGNAWYDGSSINFCRSGSGYPNTAWSSIVHHEYGHHLVALAGSGQGQYGEGMGDVIGLLILDDPGTGFGFFGNCNEPLRTGDNNMQYPCSGEIHFCGQLISGCVWSTRNELAVTEPNDYLEILSNLTINSILLHNGSNIDPSITIDFLTLDDDNGNIFDGTPHYAEIAAGFGAHNMDAPELQILGFGFPDGLPEIVDPMGGDLVRVEVSAINESPEPGTGMFYANLGGGWTEAPMTEISPNVYDATFQASDCGSALAYYFSAETTGGTTVYWPTDAPANVLQAISAVGSSIALEDDFNSNLGWGVGSEPGLTAGEWERGTPIGGGDRGDPPTDYDGSGQCYLTGNSAGDSDVDGGRTWLISPQLDLADAVNARVSYALWYTNNFGADPNNDYFNVHVSNDDGVSWVLARTIGPVSLSGWNELDFLIGDFVSLSDQVRVRFEASDLLDGSVVEAGLDQVKVTAYECTPDDVTVLITPDNPPVVVPPGGSFTFDGSLTNNADAPATVDAWIVARLPGGTEVEPGLIVRNVTLNPDQTLELNDRTQEIPLRAPAGAYTYIARAGTHPDTILSESLFPVTVTSGSGAD